MRELAVCAGRKGNSALALNADTLGGLVEATFVPLDLVRPGDHLLEVRVGALSIGINCPLAPGERLAELIKEVFNRVEALVEVLQEGSELGIHFPAILRYPASLGKRQWQGDYMLLRYCPPTWQMAWVIWPREQEQTVWSHSAKGLAPELGPGEAPCQADTTTIPLAATRSTGIVGPNYADASPQNAGAASNNAWGL